MLFLAIDRNINNNQEKKEKEREKIIAIKIINSRSTFDSLGKFFRAFRPRCKRQYLLRYVTK